MSGRSTRRAQTVSTEGVGALVDIGDESFVVCDVGHWNDKKLIEIRLPRLERRLQVKKFKTPEGSSGFGKKSHDVKFARFPCWLFCPICRRMVEWKFPNERKNSVPVCLNPRCKHTHLVPMRFVLACTDGHLSDIPWNHWVHSTKGGSSKPCTGPKLAFFSNARGTAGLESLFIKCYSCEAVKSFAGLASKGSMDGFIQCRGTQPWMNPTGEEECDKAPMVLQRGASNVYYSKTESALDISSTDDDDSDAECIRKSPHYESLRSLPDEAAYDKTVEHMASTIAKQCECSSEDVLKVLKEDRKPVSETSGSNTLSLLEEEWQYITEIDRKIETRNFVARKKSVADLFDGLIDNVVLIDRLREVRALAGYTRVNPPGDDAKLVSPHAAEKYDWLPGIEVFGEGIFIQFSETAIQKWLSDHSEEIANRLKTIEDRYESVELGFLPEFSSKFILLHSITHLLLRQLVHESGYSGAALRERIYSADSEENPMAGILIYTADSDSEGSMGGLVRQGEPERLADAMLAAVSQGSWCSVDPICSELTGQGFEGLNRAACHACALVAETSCICSNVLLDRVLVVGDINQNSEFGYFSNWLRTEMEAAL